MKVKAKFADGKFGFYGGIRVRNGDVFHLQNPKHFSERWMVKVDEKPRRGRPPSEETETMMDEGAE